MFFKVLELPRNICVKVNMCIILIHWAARALHDRLHERASDVGCRGPRGRCQVSGLRCQGKIPGRLASVG
jgi:hypothetical protein